ncbi:short-chain dehydrogenase [Pyronema omphalodes]|nr:short-chain dehydrogenase [Pyronema omphalodes]
MSNQILKGKLAIVTGASKGIGEAIAHNLASKGCSIILNHSSPSSASQCSSVQASLSSKYPFQIFLVVQADLGTLDGPRQLIAACEGSQIDIIINNSGVAGNQLLPSVTMSQFERQYNINVRGPLLLVQAALEFLPKDRSGRIVNLSSISSSMGFIGQSVYGGTKAALEAMTRTWARELADRATVNAVNPGPIDTRMYQGTEDWFQEHIRPALEMTPVLTVTEKEKMALNGQMREEIEKAGGRRGLPEEVAGVVGSLCLPEMGFCTGQVVCANGGMRFQLG